ncbi:MAG TPA: hypothetical protein VET27_00010 [Mycobacterium sp.]|nr:hypothetical protein [Mycobacterium sp.]
MVSGFGTRAQWFGNVQVNRRARVFLAGHTPAPALARTLTQPEPDAAMAAYTRRHRRANGDGWP